MVNTVELSWRYIFSATDASKVPLTFWEMTASGRSKQRTGNRGLINLKKQKKYSLNPLNELGMAAHDLVKIVAQYSVYLFIIFK
jgi:hypothetical protein